MDNLDYVSLKRLNDIVDSLNLQQEKCPEHEIKISFEFIVGSLFPESWQNLKNLVAAQYIKGYMDGRQGLEGVSET